MSALLATVQVRLAIADRALPARAAHSGAAAPAVRRRSSGQSSIGAWSPSPGSSAVLDVLSFFLQRFGVPREPFLLVTMVARLVFAVVFLRLVWRVRAPIAAKIRGDGQSTLRRLLADLWPALMTAYVLCLLVVLTVEQLAGRLRTGRAGILSLLVVLAMPLVDMALCRLLDRRAARARPDGGAQSGATFRPVLRRGVHIVVTAAGVLVIVHLWNLDLVGLASPRRRGSRGRRADRHRPDRSCSRTSCGSSRRRPSTSGWSAKPGPRASATRAKSGGRAGRGSGPSCPWRAGRSSRWSAS